MWIGQKIADSTRAREDSTAVDLGITTIGGKTVAAETRGEDRNLPLYGPFGYFWHPNAGDRVLVIKGGVTGEEQCVAGVEQGNHRRIWRRGIFVSRQGRHPSISMPMAALT